MCETKRQRKEEIQEIQKALDALGASTAAVTQHLSTD